MIIVRSRGRLANQMFQLMLAVEIRDRAGKQVPIVGYDLPEWGLKSPSFQPPDGRRVLLQRHIVPLEQTAYLLRSGIAKSVIVGAWGMRLEYYRKPERYRSLFKHRVAPRHRLSENDLLINIRLEDIMSGGHPRYHPLPFAFYQRIIDETGLNPIFMGQLLDNDYVGALKAAFPRATFLPPASPLEDFELMRSATNIVLAVSSFSWLSTWLSETCRTIHLPVCGLFDPRNGETMLLPVDDPRYRFYDVPFPDMAQRKDIQLVQWANAPADVREMNREEVEGIVFEQHAGQRHP